MAMTGSTDPAPGSSAPDFSLPDPRTGKTVSLSDFSGSSLVVAFICNHCPYVIHIVDALVRTASDLEAKGVRTVAISANDVANYPADAPHKMALTAEGKNFGFPYLYDESQSVARAYNAVCTPDLYLFDADHKLFYRGQFDATRPGNGTATGVDLRAAVDDLLGGESEPAIQTPSVGCGIKWKAA